MNVAIVGIDTRGGIQPYVGLALGLRRAGHGVRMIIPANAVALAAEWGITAYPLSVDIQALLQGVDVTKGGRTGTRQMRGQMREMLPRLMAEAPAGWSPPPDLAAFLSAGDQPICFGFRSMPNDDPAALAELLVTAARRVGRRAVLLSGWGGLEIAAAEDVYVAEAVPHEWLFPRVAAVVHHGGAGTTGAALRAGVPAVVVPHGADQSFWGARVAALGVGPQPIPRQQLNAPGLTSALDLILTDRAMRSRSAVLGEQLRAEDGVGTAAELLERCHAA